MRTVEIGEKVIGDSRPLFIVAEVGTTIGVDLETGLRLIRAAREAGADAIKPILTDPENLLADRSQTYRHRTIHGVREDNLFSLLSETVIPLESWKILKEEAEDAGLIFYLTVDTPRGVKLAEEIGSPAYKISSWDLRNAPLIKALGGTQKPVMVDLGPAVIGEVHNVLDALRRAGNREVVLLHATHAKDTSELNLASILYLRGVFPDIPVGWSNDGPESTPDVLAIGQRACLIEKRLTLDRFETRRGHHHWNSLAPFEFQIWAERMRWVEKMMGRDGLFPSFEDIRQRDLYYTSLRAIRDIKTGETIGPEDLCAKRPGNGISPFYAYCFEGKKALRDIQKDQALVWEDVH